MKLRNMKFLALPTAIVLKSGPLRHHGFWRCHYA